MTSRADICTDEKCSNHKIGSANYVSIGTVSEYHFFFFFVKKTAPPFSEFQTKICMLKTQGQSSADFIHNLVA